MHYKRETTERRLYSLRDQLKVQFRATQKAQVSERKEASSKRRLTSYIFHEVRDRDIMLVIPFVLCVL
jgi:osomolarity two-component system, sensor histidine kinase SLN1